MPTRTLSSPTSRSSEASFGNHTRSGSAGVFCGSLLGTLCIALSGAFVVGCGARLDSDAVTETGNPSFIKDTRITATPLDGVIIVKGASGAVPDGADVALINETTDKSETTKAEADGSFELTLEGKQGDTLVLEVESDGKIQTKRIDLDVAPVPPASTNPTPPAQRVPLLHRAERETCDDVRPPGSFEDGEVPFDDTQCSRDADCTDGVRGRCQLHRVVACSYDECTQDSECSTGGPCGCEMDYSSDANACLGGNCQIDSDCGAGGYCSPSMGTCGTYLGIVAYWCHTPADECVDDIDCVDPEMGAGYCMYSSEVTHWVCAYSSCAG